MNKTTETRKIKFRAWDDSSNRYREVRKIDFESQKVECRWEEGDRVSPGSGDVFAIGIILLDFGCLEQSTGLYDKNGKEIYEGDIMKWGIHLSYIEFDKNQALFSASDVDDKYAAPLYIILHGKSAEVIGNIHENGGLLNED